MLTKEYKKHDIIKIKSMSNLRFYVLSTDLGCDFSTHFDEADLIENVLICY